MSQDGTDACRLGDLIEALVGEYDRRAGLGELHESFVGGETVDEVLKVLVVRAFRGDPEPRVLTADQRIRGRFFVFEYTSHVPVWHLETLGSLHDAERVLEGMLNPFEAGMVVLEGLRACPYEIWCDYGDGEFVLFSKRSQLTLTNPFQQPQPQRVRIRWQGRATS